MTAIMIANISVKNTEKFQQYLAKTQEVARPFGAELLVRAKFESDLTGEDKDHGLVVIVKFPDVRNLTDWYQSDAYQSLVPLRLEAADIKMTSYEVMV